MDYWIKKNYISACAFIILLIFLILGFVVAILELADAIKKDSSKGPLSLALKSAICGCLPQKSAKTVEKDDKEEIPISAETEKQNGDNIA